MFENWSKYTDKDVPFGNFIKYFINFRGIGLEAAESVFGVVLTRFRICIAFAVGFNLISGIGSYKTNLGWY